jgi:carboxypeptidase C (cathepsin A)
MKVSVLVAVFVVCVSAAMDYTPEAASDQITNLPGAPANLPFNQYGGYLNVDSKNNRNIFYWFVESMNKPATDPVVFWTNGGPGCSGLIGFMTEQGPFHPNSDGATLTLQPYPWNKIANMVFIEAPAGVGFSYSDVASDYHTGDAKTAQDNYMAILAFMAKYPQLANNSYYITSESYGGHYMPTWAQAIVQGNAAGVNPKINFKGFMVGNPFTDQTSNNYGTFTTFYGHQLVAKPQFDSWQTNCPSNPGKCAQAEAEMELQIGNLNPYALDYPVCLSPSKAKAGRAQRLWLMNYILPEHRKLAMNLTAPGDYDPCVDNYAVRYLNRADVQTAIHAKPAVWTECSTKIVYNTSDSLNPMEPIYKNLIDNYKLHILVYSGDDDSVCATSGSQYWIYNLGYPITKSWATWTDNSGQVGGYLVEFSGFKFVTVHTAGHEVPTYEPERALELFTNYLAGKW